MTDTSVIQAAGILPGSALAAEISAREDIFAKTAAAEVAVLTPDDAGGLSHSLRQALAARVAALTGEAAEAARYKAMVADPAIAALAEPGSSSADPQVQAILTFTDAISTNPRDMTAADVKALQQAAISDADIVRLAELNAFLAYQLRVIAGLRLMVEFPK